MASYGKASREEHIKGGNILPLSAYVDAEADGSGQPSAEEQKQLEALRAEGKNAAPVTAENKALTPVTAEKAPARKTARRK